MPATPPKTVSLSYFFKYLKPYAAPALFTALLLAGGRAAAAYEPVILAKLIDSLSRGTAVTALTATLGAYFAARLAAAIFDYLRDYVFAPVEMGISRALSRDLMTHLLRLPVGFHYDQRLGGINRQLGRGTRAITFIMDFLVSSILPTLVELIIVAGLFLKLFPVEYALITVVTVIAYLVFTIWATEKRQVYRLASIEADDTVGSVENDGLAHIETIKYFASERTLLQKYEPALESRYGLSVKSNRLFSLVAAGQGVILLAGLGAILVLGVRSTAAGALTIGSLVLLTTTLTRLAGPIGMLGFVYRGIKDGLADLTGIAGLLEQPVSIAEPLIPKRIESPEGEVELRGVSFTYATGKQVLDDVSLVVPAGSRIAFVGPSGVGKSTIVKLLFRLFEPQAGRLLIDGIGVDEMAAEERAAVMALVPQEPALFNASIADNIRFGKPDASDAEIRAAADLANATGFIDQLDEGFETKVGERGVKLSGGQKQRIAIARAVVKDPKVMVFDEATSALDTHSERLILDALRTAAAGRTTIAVAHRLSTIADSDRIYVLDGGKIRESGTHAQLLASGGLYSELWALQSNAEEEGSGA